MSLTLFVENNPQIESIYTLNLQTWLGLQTEVKKNALKACEALKNQGATYQLIIVRSRLQQEKSQEETAKTVLMKLKQLGLKIPVIVIGPGKDFDGHFAHLANSLDLKSLIQAAAKACGITAQDMMKKPVPDYFPIPIGYFAILKHSVSDLYYQEGSTYLPLTKANQEFDEKVFQKIKSSTHLFINKMERLNFVSHLTSEYMALLNFKEISEDEAMVATDKGVALLSKKLITIGMTEETIGLAKKNLDVIKKNVLTHPKLAKLLGKLLANQTSYVFKHTQILSYIGLHIIKNIDWGNAEQEEKVSFVSFFHDIVLEKDEEAQIKSNLELKKSSLPPSKKQLVERHAQLAAEFVSKYPHAPMGADQIIRQHHGTLNGIGFSEHYGNNVSPMAIVLLVAEEFTRIILKREQGPFNIKEMIRELKEEFPGARFKKTIELLESITF